MNLKKIYKSAKTYTPQIEKKVIAGAYRHNVIDSLQGNDNIGIELGVAQGGFSKKWLILENFLISMGLICMQTLMILRNISLRC